MRHSFKNFIDVYDGSYNSVANRYQNIELGDLLANRKDYFNTLSIHNILNPSLRDDILNKLILECKNKSDIYNKINQQDFVTCFSDAILLLIRYKSSKLYVQLTLQNSLVVKGVNEKGNTFLEFFFDESNGCLTQTVANIFAGKEMQLSESGDISDVFSAVKYFYNVDVPVSKSFINACYEVPADTFAEAEL